MKKIIYFFSVLIMFAGTANAQIFTPSIDLTLRGNYSFLLSDSLWKRDFKSFPGVQLDAVVNLTSSWGIAGTFGADFITAKERSVPGETFTQEASSQLSGYIGPRYYINLPGNQLVKIYIDAAAGLYSFKGGNAKLTETTNPPAVTTATYHSVSQFGFNAGAGLNVSLGPKMFANFMVKYHNIPKKTDALYLNQVTFPNGTVVTNTGTETIPSRSYIQLGVGIGFNFGM